ncbi:phosphate ABC transporter permease subunit PstC [Afifella sp. H1R]|uniref:phosphate ABC transporter permease subunit PstC n=1 Tax=Afifella sp. H1R TaxID=2908841 RepID=UPI001F31E329|nr:phosphate ABC transporter permease subunit PstC [Afifella sp. H1R]
MSDLIIVGILLTLMALGYQVALGRYRKVTGHSDARPHSRPAYHGLLVAIWCAIPALAVIIVFGLFEPIITRYVIFSALPPEVRELPAHELRSVMQRIHQIATGFGIVGEAKPYENVAATRLGTYHAVWNFALIALVASSAVAGLVYTLRRITPRLRARNEVERVIRVLLLLCSAVAIMTTVGIVASLLGEAVRFFGFVNPLDFFFGTVWNPRFSSVGAGQGDFGLLPLLVGTLMISAIAILVALPIGLMTAIYMAEYASSHLRNIAKPIIEILAGIPTIVYGVFALTVAGPFFADMGAAVGLDISATSAFTAGAVMGVMIIPFISSLSDDIITQVPASMRDGSLGLGATRSETIKRVILPAALPGIVGAFLLAVSRAIGETMIVVLAAGNSPVLRFNPFEPSTSVTVSIVNQLTGDTDFASPQSLVAFALGLTLFIMTLGLNVVALYIVRKYREQYE